MSDYFRASDQLKSELRSKLKESLGRELERVQFATGSSKSLATCMACEVMAELYGEVTEGKRAAAQLLRWIADEIERKVESRKIEQDDGYSYE
jgi:Asp-tRNA(Asn)/Glu-tRNA(Gln) amidotransferase B subunit